MHVRTLGSFPMYTRRLSKSGTTNPKLKIEFSEYVESMPGSIQAQDKEQPEVSISCRHSDVFVPAHVGSRIKEAGQPPCSPQV